MHVPNKVRHLLALAALISVATPNWLWADELTLTRAEALALQHNPAMAAVTKNAEAMAAIPSQAGSLPDPTLSLNVMNLPVDTFSTTQEAMTQLQLGVTQAIPFPGSWS
ncbi:outer membrane efflux protein [Mariprofundus ferrooxydans]|uniref:Outer membrane efflux protein n=1 Tax=Mariprofundus ferrooxydans PV-1 TaxID=314345 RepID=Q0F122_9PROT|nr:outer membrane efflux protein [Mariprofundus ferrooxydans]EAU55369.1 Outer membrane efflux protein [Mariprofundus ferrooxydans PV-1]